MTGLFHQFLHHFSQLSVLLCFIHIQNFPAATVPQRTTQALLSLEKEFSRGDLEMPHASREVPLLEPSHMGQRQGWFTLDKDGQSRMERRRR